MDTPPSATRFEDDDRDPPPARTRLEGADPPARTRLDTAREPSSTPSAFPIHLPSQLHGRFDLVRRLGGGAEAKVWLIRDTAGREYAFKDYFRHPSFPAELGSDDYKAHFSGPHTVQVFERDRDSDRTYEVMEYCRAGSLADHLGGRRWGSAEITEVVRQLSTALHKLHPYVHGDIKPSNILVRSENPLELALTDFGLTVDPGDRSRLTNTGRGTTAYLAPGGDRAIRRAHDWWSLGMVVLDLVLGHNVFQTADGRWMAQHVIEESLSIRPIPLDGVQNPRLLLLLKGLLQRDPDLRWTYPEVSAWLRGETPPVTEDAGARSTHERDLTSPARQPFPFDGRLHSTPAALGAALEASPNAERFASGVELDDLVEWMEGYRFATQVARVAEKREVFRGPLTAGLVAALLQPGGRPIFHGVDLGDPAALGSYVVDASDAEIMEMFNLRVFRQFGVLLDMPELTLLDERWRSLSTDAEQRIPTRNLALETAGRRRRLALQLLLSDGSGTHVLAAQAQRECPDDLRRVPWVASLLDPAEDDVPGVVALLSVLPNALTDLERDRQERAAEDQRRLAERRTALTHEADALQGQIDGLESRLGIGDAARPSIIRASLSSGVTTMFVVMFGLSVAFFAYLLLWAFFDLRVSPPGVAMKLVHEVVLPDVATRSFSRLPTSPQMAVAFAGALLIVLRNLGLPLFIVAHALRELVIRRYGPPTRSACTTVACLAIAYLVLNPVGGGSLQLDPAAWRTELIVPGVALLIVVSAFDAVLTGRDKEPLEQLTRLRGELEVNRRQQRTLGE